MRCSATFPCSGYDIGDNVGNPAAFTAPKMDRLASSQSFTPEACPPPSPIEHSLNTTLRSFKGACPSFFSEQDKLAILKDMPNGDPSTRPSPPFLQDATVIVERKLPDLLIPGSRFVPLTVL